MAAKKKKKSENKPLTVEEPASLYVKKEIQIFRSHEDHDEYKIRQMALLTPQQSLEQLRKLINLAYGMHGYDPKKLPKKHSIKIIQEG